MEEDIDRFDTPSYSSEQIEFEEEGISAQLGAVTGPLKKNLKLIVAILLLAVVGWFAYNFFVGSMREIEIVIKNTEGEYLAQNQLKILDSGNTEIIALSGESSYTQQLRAGNYKYEATIANYETVRGSLSVTSSGETTYVVAEKNIGVDIVDFKDSFNSEWIEGQSRTIEFQVKNNKSTAQEIEIIFEDDLEDWSVPDKSATIQPKSTQTVFVQVGVPTNLEIKNDEEGDELKASARIKYTKVKQSKSFVVFPRPDLELKRVSVASSADAGQTISNAKVKIENGSEFQLEDLELKIEITSAPKNGAAKVLKWFKFQEKAEDPEAWKIEIPQIAADTDMEKTIRIDIPLTAKKETITGKVVLSASFLPEPLAQTFNLEIDKEANYGLQLSAKELIRVDWSEESGRYEKLTEILQVENTGDIALSNIIISVKNPLVCSTDWLQLLPPTSIAGLAKSDEQELTMKASAPIAQRNNESSILCRIKYRFDNPLAGATGEPDFIEDEMENWIEIEPQLD